MKPPSAGGGLGTDDDEEEDEEQEDDEGDGTVKGGLSVMHASTKLMEPFHSSAIKGFATTCKHVPNPLRLFFDSLLLL